MTAAGLLAVVVLSAAACGPSPSDEETPRESSTPTKPAASGAKSAGVVGKPGSACELPVTFEIAAKWKPQKVDAEALGGSVDQGGLTPACEVDAKPAGNLGMIRVWVGGEAGADPKQALETFIGDGAGKVEGPTFDALGKGRHVVYTRFLPEMEERKKEAAFAVPTSEGLAIVTLSGLDSEEYEEMLPAYELAKKTVRAS